MLPRAEIQQKIKLFLYEQLVDDGGIAACLIIHSCNPNKEKVRASSAPDISGITGELCMKLTDGSLSTIV